MKMKKAMDKPDQTNLTHDGNLLEKVHTCNKTKVMINRSRNCLHAKLTHQETTDLAKGLGRIWRIRNALSIEITLTI
jgi:hypothetical protein